MVLLLKPQQTLAFHVTLTIYIMTHISTLGKNVFTLKKEPTLPLFFKEQTSRHDQCNVTVRINSLVSDLPLYVFELTSPEPTLYQVKVQWKSSHRDTCTLPTVKAPRRWISFPLLLLENNTDIFRYFQVYTLNVRSASPSLVLSLYVSYYKPTKQFLYQRVS